MDWPIFGLTIIIAKLVFVSHTADAANPHYVYREDWKETGCGAMLRRVRTQLVSSTQPPDITGDWVSTRCEIRSGPEYVIRYFKFNNITFHSVVYHYADPNCNKPLYAIESRGTHHLQQASWTVQGGTEAAYEVLESYIVPYTKNVTGRIADKLAVECKDLHAYKHLRPFSRHLIYKAPPFSNDNETESEVINSDNINSNSKLHRLRHSRSTSSSSSSSDDGFQLEKDCFKAFNFSLHELQLVLVQQKRHKQKHLMHHRRRIPHKMAAVANAALANESLKDLHATRELLLGAVHSKPSKRQNHRPSSFQTPLKDGMTPGCGICSRIMSADALYPPRLSSHSGTLLSLEGQWVSTRCESRQYGMFLTRWLKFLPDGQSWQGQYDYYHDPMCQKQSFSLLAKGNFVGGTNSHLVEGAKDFSFKVTRLRIVPHDQPTANSLNHYNGNGCGKAHAWKVGVEQDVTWTGGCVTLGIRLPNMERDIMKMEIVHRKLHLYVGQRLLDRKAGPYRHERPTAFQEALVKCDDQNLDMSVNTAPGGHSWAGGVALPLASGPDNLLPSDKKGSASTLQNSMTLNFFVVLVWVVTKFRAQIQSLNWL